MYKKFIFDLDDTLIYTHIHYVRAQNRFAKFVLDNFEDSKCSLDDIIEIQISRQMNLVKKFGFNTEVFPQSFKDVYI